MTTVLPAPPILFLEEFLKQPETKLASEYINGRVYQKPMPQGKHSCLQTRFSSEINQIKDWAIRVLEVAPDYIHLFVETHPTDAINQVVKAFKVRSATMLRREFPELQKLPSLWTNSYFFSTAENVSTDTIQRYINHPHDE
jgi:putative transposase